MIFVSRRDVIRILQEFLLESKVDDQEFFYISDQKTAYFGIYVSQKISWYLPFHIALAICDNLFIITMIINKGTRAGAGFDNNFKIYPITNFLRQFAYTTSIYITVGLSLER